MKLAVIGSNPFGYVIKSYLENVKGLDVSVLGKTHPTRFFFWAEGDDRDVVEKGLQESKIAYEEVPFPTAVLFNGDLITSRSDDVEGAFYAKTQTDIPFIGENVVTFVVSTPEDASEWILGETDWIRPDKRGGFKVKILGTPIDAEDVLATIPLPVLGRVLGRRLRVSRLYLQRQTPIEIPFNVRVPYKVIWDATPGNDVFRWVKHGSRWYKEVFSFSPQDQRGWFPHIRNPLRMTSYSNIKLYGPFAQWDPSAGLASVFKRLKEEF